VGNGSLTFAAGVTTDVAVDSVRYAWSDYVDCVVVNADGLALAPFLEVNLTSTDTNHDASSVEALSTTSITSPLLEKNAPLIMSPPMGFNSWNFYHCNIDENIVKQMADFFVSTGMAAVNYTYINIARCFR